MKQHQTLTKLEKQLISKLEQATVVLKETDTKLENYRKEVAQLKAKLLDGPSLPANFKPSAGTMALLNTAKAGLSSAQKQLQQEIDHHNNLILADIATRSSKAVAKYEYKKALEGSYSQAVQAIAAKKLEVQNNGVDVHSGLNGSFKALVDWQDHSLFTFEQLFESDLEIEGQAFTVTSAKLCPVQSGNVYHFAAARHSTR